MIFLCLGVSKIGSTGDGNSNLNPCFLILDLDMINKCVFFEGKMRKALDFFVEW